MIREKASLEAQLRGDPELPPEYDSDEFIEYLPECQPCLLQTSLVEETSLLH
jgi:hypothetical protein